VMRRILLVTKTYHHSVVLEGGVVATLVLGFTCDSTDHLLLTNFNVL